MAKFCSNCGEKLQENATFCPKCGSAVEVTAPQHRNIDDIPPYSTVGNGVMPQPGFSDRVNDPEILAAVKKNKKAAGIFGLIIVPLPLIGFVIYSLISDKMETGQGLMIGALVSLVFLIFAVRSMIKSRPTNTYEGIVTDKKTKERSDNDENNISTYTEYITYVKTTDGKKKKIREPRNPIAYNYLQIGDRFKYHPQFNFSYELYDKSKAPYIPCVSCGTHNPVTADRCSKCNIPLLK